MDSGTDAAWYRLCARKRRPDRREGRSLLGRAVLSLLRHARTDHPQTDQRFVAGDLRLRAVLRAVLHPRRGSRRPQTVLVAVLTSTSGQVYSRLRPAASEL